MFESNPLIKVRWKDHGSIIMSNLVKLLQEDEEFADVRVRHAARTVKAHRTMLAANSAMFRAYLTSAGSLAGAAAGAGAVTALELGSVPCLESILQAKGADAVLSELEQIVHLVYCGWVDLREHHIGSLLETARCLQFGDVCQVLQRTMQARAGTAQQPVQHVPPPPPPPPTLTPTLTLPPPPAAHTHPAIPVSGPESLEHHLSVSELTMRDLQEAMLSHESSLPWSPEIAELHPMPVEQRPDPPAPPPPPPPAPPVPAVSLSQLLSSPSDSGLRHEDAAGLTAASLCEVVFQPTTCTSTAPLSHQAPLTVVSAASADTPTPGGAAGPAAQEGGHSGPPQQQRPGDGQARPAGPQDSAPLLRVRTQFELHCPWGVDMEQAGRKRPDHGWPGILMPAPPPPPARPAPPPAAAAAAAAADPPLSTGTGAGGLVAEEEQAIIDHCGLPPSTPDTLERFDENFSGLTEEEKSPMPPKAARVRRYRRRATMRARIRKVPALISLDQSCVCQVCGRDLGRMAALQRHIATEHADRPAVSATGTGAGTGAGEERLPASTVDTSAIADPGDTCAGLMSFRTRLTAAAEAAAAEVAALAEVVESSERLASARAVDSAGTAPPGGEDGEPTDTAGKAAQEPRGPSEPWLAVETVLDTEHPSDDTDCDDPAPDGQPGDETPPLVIAERQGERGSTVRVQLQRLPDSGQPAPAADRAATVKSLRKHSASLACSHCPLQFRQAAALYRHVARVHPTVPSRLTKCLICPYQSPRPSTIRRHMRDVHGQDTQGRQLPRNLLCGQCDYATCSELKLKQHERRKHTVDKEFKCSECSYSSVDKQALTKHYRIMHTEDRPYRCEICDFRSATLSRISRHRRSHTQERPHECTMCGYRYADLRRLREHMQAVHEPAGGDGEGSSFFQCKFCVRVFARRDNMQQHVRKIHSSKARLDSF